MARFGLFSLMLVLAALVGCGTNSDGGLSEIPLEVDLEVEDQDVPGSVVESQSWTLQVTVANTGGIDARAFEVEVEVRSGGALLSTGSTLVETGLSAGDVLVVSVNMSGIGSIGLFTGTIEADADQTIQEADENNNQANFTVTVTGAGEGAADGAFGDKLQSNG